MKRFFAGLLVVGMMGTVLTGCKSQGTDSASGNAAADASGTDTTVLVLANSAPASEDNHMYQYCEKFKELVEEKSNGSVEIEIHPMESWEESGIWWKGYSWVPLISALWPALLSETL